MRNRTSSLVPGALLLALATCVSATPPAADPTLWLTAEAGIVLDEEGAVERWEDQSGNAHHFEQDTPAKRPAVLAGGFARNEHFFSRLPLGQNGNSSWNAVLGADFVVEEEVIVSQLAAFDDRQDGFAGPITVQIWQRHDGGTALSHQDDSGGLLLETMTFTPDAPGTLEGGYRWKSLAEAGGGGPRTLPPGSYTLVAWGFSGSDYSVLGSTVKPAPQESGLRWQGISRYGQVSNEWPATYYTGDPGYVAGSMNLRFAKSGEAPSFLPAVRFDGQDDGLLARESLNLGRPSTVFTVFEREGTDSGYLLQNSDSGSSWWIRSDGYYANGWVKSTTLDWKTPQVATMLQTETGTRAYRNFSDLTEDHALAGAAPGRLALGGGSGRYQDPLAVKVAEVLAYDRELSASEIWQTQSYLSEKYGIAPATVESPQISPPGDLGTGAVQVTLTCGTPEAELHYTTDGSEPTASSARYTAPLDIPRGTEVKARAFLDGAAASGVSSQYYADAEAQELPVAGLQLWLRGDRGITTDAAGNVSRWQDLTGQGNDMVQGVAWQRPRPSTALWQHRVAIRASHGNVGSTTYNGTLGTDFRVTEPVVLTELGAFDHLGDGFSTAVTVQIWSRNDPRTPATPEDDTAGTLLAEREFTPEDPGTLEGSTRLKTIPELQLEPGEYTILAWGFTGANEYRNSTGGSAQGSGIEFVNRSRHASASGAWPTTIDSHPLKYNGAGNFRFHLAEEPPAGALQVVEFDGADDGLWALPTSQIGRPSTVYLAFERSTDGILLQSTSGSGWWFVRHDGGYAGNWIRNQAFPAFQPQIVGMSNGDGQTRLYVNGDDWTADSGFAAAVPGRLALGGGNGYSYHPSRSQIAEVLAFGRELNAAERWQVERYLAQRYQRRTPLLPPVEMSPAGDYGTGSVTVTLSHRLPGVEIRYTLDGSEPAATSPLYAEPLEIHRGTLVRSRAFLDGAPPSAVREEWYGEAGGADDLPVAGASMWLRADSGVEADSSGGVSRWRDLSGNGNDLVQGAATKRPQWQPERFAAQGSTAILVNDGDGSSTWGGTLAEDFLVEEPLSVTHLGAFDHRKDGFAGTITVQLWRRDDGGTPDSQTDDSRIGDAPLAELSFGPDDPGTLEGVMRFKELPAALTLPPGAYTVCAWGYQGHDLYYEGPRSQASSDPRFRFIGVSRYHSAPDTWPTALDSRPLDYNGAANFKVAPAPSLPLSPSAVVFDGDDDGLLGVEDMDFSRPSTVLIVFERDRDDSGYLLQNTTGGNWWIRNDGFYVDGWVHQQNFGIRQPYLAAVVNEETATRTYRNGIELTSNSSLAGSHPGRLAVGGGSGRQYDPLPVSVAEIIVFDRALDEQELHLLQTELAQRHRLYEVPLTAPAISPASGYGDGDVEVTLTHSSPEAELRYTLDGSSPGASSTLYTGAFAVPRDTTVHARAFFPGGLASETVSSFYGSSASHPLPVTDAALWLRADTGVETRNDGTLSRWRDLSGHGRDFVSTRRETSPVVAREIFGGSVRPAIATPAGATGTRNDDGFLGTDFLVEEPVEITHLGAFDHYGDGFSGDVTVSLFRIDDNGTPDDAADDLKEGGALATATFTAAAPGRLDGGTRYLPLDPPLALSPGRYFVQSAGWTGVNLVPNHSNWSETLTDEIRFPGVSRSSASEADILPGSRVNDNRHLAAGSFQFRRQDAAGPAHDAVRFDGVDDGLLGPQSYFVRRPSTLFMVFNQLGGTDGRLIQSASNQNWLLGPHLNNTDGMYANGWVAEHTIRRNQPSQVIAVQDVNDTRYFYNGVDLTQNPNPLGDLGRVALGGAEGEHFQPVNADLAELIIYDRVLTAAERQQVSAALAARYTLPLESLLPPVASPDGGYYASAQTISLSHPVPAAEIRYTTDGSEPDGGSPLYTGPFQVSSDLTVKSKAFAPGYLPSSTRESHFRIDPEATEIPQRESLQLWLRAGVGSDTEEGALVRWRDLSGSGMDARQPTAAARPALSPTAIGGAPGIVFDGDDDFLELPEGFEDYRAGLTAIFVARPDAVAYDQRLLDLGRSTSGNHSSIIFGRHNNTNGFLYQQYGSGRYLVAENTFQSQTNAIYTVCQQPDGSVKIFHNGSLAAESANVPLPLTVRRTIGRIGASTYPYQAKYSGALSEILLFNTALEDLERESLETAIRLRYGIASTATGTVAFSPDPAELRSAPFEVTLTSVTPDARIHYTLDGSIPDESSTLYTGPFELQQSTRIRARAFADGYNASQFSEATYLIGQPPGSGDGLLATYYDTPELGGTSRVRIDPAINFTWGYEAPDPAIPPSAFSARWEGRILPQFTEDHTFFTDQDDGMRVWIDLNQDGDFSDESELLIDDWSAGGRRERSSPPVPLLAGELYGIRVEYFQSNSYAVARLLWNSFSVPKAAVPQSQLFSNAEFEQTVATPVLSPAAGTYTDAVEVTMTSATPDATITYTTDGSEPTLLSPVYGGGIPVGASTTFKARAFKAGFNPSGIATAHYEIDADPPLITAFSWDGEELADGETFTAKGLFRVSATDNQGIARAEFYYQPEGVTTRALIGSDATPADGLQTEWNIATIADGPYLVTVRVYDTGGTWAERSHTIHVALAPPAAPHIAEPADGISIEAPVVGLRVESEPNANIRIFRDNVFLFAGYASSSGLFQYSASLPTGTSAFKAVAQNRTGPSADSNLVRVTRVREFPQLALSFDNNTVGEGLAVTGTVAIPAALTADLSVQITTNKASRMEPVPPVLLPAGSTSATFSLTARQDSLLQLLTTVLVTASATEHRSVTEELFLADDDAPLLTLTLDQTSVAESHGTLSATIQRQPSSDRSLLVHLRNSHPDDIRLPATIEIPANETSRTFTLTVVDNDLQDGNRTAKVRGEVLVDTTVVAASPDAELEIRDDEGPVLTLELAKPFLRPGDHSTGTVRRVGTADSQDLVVRLSQSPSGILALPAQVVLPAGTHAATFDFSVSAVPSEDPARVTVRASADDYTDGFATVSVTDQTLPDLAVTSLQAAAAARTEQNLTIGYRVDNHGFAPAKGPYLERIFLSRDPSPGGGDRLVRQIEFTGEVAAGAGYARNVSILTPREAGTYYLIVTADPAGAVQELDKANNTGVLIQPIEILASYSAVVETAVETVPANTPILFTGSATTAAGGPAVYSMVNIHIALHDTRRVISAVTDSLGQFATTWTPLPNEGGRYTIGASHPGVDYAPAQDSFEILTLGLDPPAAIAMHESETVVAQAVIRNPNARELNGISLTASALPDGLTVTPQLPATTLAAGEEMTVTLSVAARQGVSGTGTFPLRAETAEGISVEAQLSVRIDLLRPALTLEPASLSASVLRGTAKTASITVTNTGGLETGAIQVLLPEIPWLTVASANPVPTLAPGDSASISLLLAPEETVPLTQYAGTLVLSAANGGNKSVPYQFRVVSDLRGDLAVEVVDELTFFTEAAPKLQGATVTVRDAVSAEPVATGETDEQGQALFADLPEGWYRIDVEAAEHDRFSGNYYVTAGQETRPQVFVSKQLVKYSWKVEEVEIEDVYRVEVETTFETNVPAPVVTATPHQFDVTDLVALGQTKVINVTLENHGFIAAQHGRFRFSDHPFYRFTPLISQVGTIPAKSSLVVPVTITRIGVFDDEGGIITLPENQAAQGRISSKNARNAASVPCSAGAALDYDYPCGEWLISKTVIMAINGIQGNCGGRGTTGVYGFIGSFYGGGYSGPGGGPTGGSMSFSSPDPCLPLCLAQSTVDCILGYTPISCFYGAAQCVSSPSWDGCLWPLAGCVAELAKKATAGAIINTGSCIWNFGKCFYRYGGSGSGGSPAARGLRTAAAAGSQFLLDEEFRNFSPEVAAAWERIEPILRMYEAHYGSKELVEAQLSPEGALTMETYGEATQEGSPGGTVINAGEADDILAMASASGIDAGLVQRAIARWNRTRDYHARGIYELADVPEGESTDFIDRTTLTAIAEEIVQAFAASQADGFLDPMDELIHKAGELRETLLGGQGGACARVKVQISQDVMMTRTAFQASLELQNEREDELSEVGFDLQVRDAQGLPADDLFNIRITKLSGLSAADGSGQIGSKAAGSVQWTLIPRDTAALEEDTSYTIGGVIRYVQNGTAFNIPVENVPITVRPDASLDLKYFHQRDVFSDDPHTDAIEPAVPYRLAVMVENHGHGDARNLKIISGQPTIVDNEKGLYIDFRIIGTEVDGQPLSPSLTANFGDVAPGQRKIATWLMTSTLQGLFTDYSATFEHVTGLGDSRLSLMNRVEIHEMIRMVHALDEDRNDGSPDFLVNDVPDANDYPDTIHYSDGGTDLVTVRQTGTFTGTLAPEHLSITLEVGAFEGWSYIRLPDPAAGRYRLVSAVRDDGRALPLDANAWQTDRTFIGGGRRPTYEHILHLADQNSSGRYTLTYQAAGAADTEAPVSSVAALADPSPPEIPVFWSGSDDQGIAFYDVYVSVNGGDFSRWKTATRETAAIYPGTAGDTYSFYVIATDHAGNRETKAAAAEAVTTVADDNRPPVLQAIPDQTIRKGELFSVRASATDPDGADADIRYSLGTNHPGLVIDPVSGWIRWTTSETDAGKTVSVIVVATDGGSPPAVANASFRISVEGGNRPPVITQVGPQTLQSGAVLIVDVEAVDRDFPAQTLAYSLAESPAGASIDPLTGILSWSPQPEQSDASHLFTVRVTDDGSPVQSATMSFSVTVVAPEETDDRPPVFTRVPVVLWTKGTTHSLLVTAMDPDGDPIALAADLSAASGAGFSDLGNGSGRLDWNPGAAESAVYQIPLTATANGKTARASVRIRVEQDDLYWSWVQDAFGDLPGDIDLSLLDMDADPDGDKRANIHEMALLTHPLRADEVPLGIEVETHPPFATIALTLHRRTGSDGYVTLGILRSGNLLDAWEPVPPAHWTATVDAGGDEDGRPETEKVEFRVREFHPDGIPGKAFYRIESSKK